MLLVSNFSNRIINMVSERTSYGWLTEQLRSRMKDKGIRQSDVASELEGTQSTISLHFREPHRLLSQDKAYVGKFIEAHGFTKSEATKLMKNLYAQDYRDIFGSEELMRQTSLSGGNVRVRSLGESNAARLGTKSVNDVFLEFPRSFFVEALDPDDCYHLDITNDSVGCEVVREEIPAGSLAIFVRLDATIRPQEGDIVNVWLVKENIGVLKSWHKHERYTVLESYNGKVTPIIYNQGEQSITQGILVTHAVLHGRFSKRTWD